MVNVRKKEIVNEIQELLKDKENVFLIDFTGVDANKTNQFRREIKKNDGLYKVLKNRLFKKAVEDKKYFDSIKDFTVETTGFVFAGEDPTAIAKSLKDMEKDNEDFRIKGAVFLEDILEREQILKLADIPSKDVLLSKLVYVLQAPLRKLVGVMRANQRDLVLVLNQIKDKKEE